MSLLARSSLRHLLRHPWQSGLSILGVALGVAVMVGIDLANASASRAFGLSTEAVTGRATHQVVGGPSGLPDTIVAPLAAATSARVAPVVEGWVALPGRREALRVLGVDPFFERPFRPWLSSLSALGGREEGGVDLGGFLTRPDAALAARATAERLGLVPGEPFAVEVERTGTTTELTLLGTLEPADRVSREALSGLLVMDVAAAQELLGKVGRLSRIDLVLPPDEVGGAAELARVRELLPAGVRVVPAAARGRATEQMTRAFRLNLTALSLLALLCGMFLIYNSMTFSVVQRRQAIGTLRALGVTRRRVMALVLAEAAGVGAVGAALGLAAGVVMGRGLVLLTTRTINDLYFTLEVEGLSLSPAVLAKGALLGLAATVAAAAAPAWEASTAPPRSALLRSELEARAHRALPRVTAAGVVLIALGALLLAASAALVPAFGGLFAVLLGGALLTPAATVLLMNAASPPLGRLFGLLGRMAARGVTATLSRTAVAIAALMMAVSVTVGVGVMIGSFRGTVERWLESTLSADLYVSPVAEASVTDDALFPGGLLPEVARVPGVARASSVRRIVLEAPAADGAVERLQLLALDIDRRSYPGFDLKRGDPDEAWPRFQAGEAVIASAPFAYRRGLAVGDRLTLPTDRGPVELPVAAISYDYASDQGAVLLARAAYERWFDDRALSGISVYLASGADPARVTERLRRVLGERAPAASIRSNRTLKEASLEVFDRTFRITGVLRLLAGVVAFIGVLSALMALALERSREIRRQRAAVAQAVGANPHGQPPAVTSRCSR